MHKRARATTTTTNTAVSTTTTAKGGRNRTTAGSTATTAATNGNTSFQPGAAASGTATRTVPNGPPTHSGFSSVDDSFYSSWSFANRGTGLSLASAGAATTATSGVAAAAGLGGAGKSGTSGEGMQLSQGALIGIIAGGSAAGVVLLALIGYCCWKRKKTKKDEAGWWSLDDDPSKGAVRNIDQNQAGSSSRGLNNQGSEPWQSTDSFNPGPYSGSTMGEKQQQDWSRLDEKQAQHRQPQQQQQQHFSALPSSASQLRDLQSQRQELFALPPSNSRTLTPSPSTSSFQSQQPPRAPFAQSARPDTGNYSVNDVISFNGGHRQNSQYPPTSSVYPSSNAEYPRSAAATPPPSSSTSRSPPVPSSSITTSNGVTVGPQPIVASSYPPKRPPRPSEVPSAPPSPYNYVKKAERPTSRDEGIADRFMDVMTGKVGKEEEEEEKEEIKEEEAMDHRKKKRQSVKPTSSGKNKKDTIMGLTDVYAGGGEEEWAQVEVDPAARRSTLQRGSSKRSQRSQRNDDSPTKPGFPPLPNVPSPSQKQTPSSHNSSRIDSKPLKELESYFGSFAPPSRNPRALSGVSEMTTGDTSYSYGTRASTASSNTPRPGYSRQPSYGTPGNQVPTSESQASLSPLVAPQPGRPGAYGEYNSNPLSIYSAAGEVSEMSSGSSAGSPAKSRFGGGGLGLSTSSGSIGTLAGSTSAARSPLGGKDEDVFGPAASSHPLATSSTSKPSLSEQPSYPLSTAEQDILNQLGLATPSSSGERTPDLSISSLNFENHSDHESNGSLSSTGLVTPSTPQFPSSPSVLQSSSPSTLELKPPPLSKSKLAVPISPEELAANGFVPLDEMSKKLDTQYRSATLSMYNLYD
ncbi:hypothetical protein JCM5350_004624 [Sporobolomyces pararoseus]